MMSPQALSFNCTDMIYSEQGVECLCSQMPDGVLAPS